MGFKPGVKLWISDRSTLVFHTARHTRYEHDLSCCVSWEQTLPSASNLYVVERAKVQAIMRDWNTQCTYTV